LKENPALVDEITRKILEKRGLAPSASVSAESNGEPVVAIKPELARKEQPARRQPVATE
jgi:hypothetical protein